MAETQTTIDWVRVQQLQAIQQAQLPTYRLDDGRGVSPAACKAVLVAIDRHAGKTGTCWASLDTLATETQLGRRTVARACRALEAQRLLVVDRRNVGGIWQVHRRIAWANLEDLRPAAEPESTECHERPTECHQAPTECHQAPTECHQAPRLSATVAPERFTERPVNGAIKTSQRAPRPRGVGEVLEIRGKWCLRRGIKPRELQDPGQLQALHAAAADRGLVTADDAGRLLFFALARYCWRAWRRGAVGDCVALLHRLLDGTHRATCGRPWWQQIANTDEDWARAAIARSDPDPAAGPRPTAEQAESDQRAEQARERERQLRALYELT